jgi:hypothetical protein
MKRKKNTQPSERRAGRNQKRDNHFVNRPSYLNKPIPINSIKLKKIAMLWPCMQGGNAA